MTDDDLLALATGFEVLRQHFPVYGGAVGPVLVERRVQKDGSARWAVCHPPHARNRRGPAARAAYINALMDHAPEEQVQDDGGADWWIATAPAGVRARAAIAVLEEGS